MHSAIFVVLIPQPGGFHSLIGSQNKAANNRKDKRPLTLEDALLDELRRRRTGLEVLLDRVATHSIGELALVALECRRSRGLGQYVALDQLILLRSRSNCFVQ